MVHESLVAAGLEGSDGVVVCECYVVVLYQLLLRDWKFGSVLASLEGRKEGNIMAPAAAAAATEVEVTAWAAKDTSGHLAPFTFSRR
jgi:hypothetical protein